MVAIDAVGVCESTVRRRLAVFEAEWGDEIVTRIDGSHRHNFWALFVNVWYE